MVVGEDPDSKAARGKKLGLKILNEAAFKRLVGSGPARPSSLGSHVSSFLVTPSLLYGDSAGKVSLTRSEWFVFERARS